ncbi:MAG: ORF6N domain-containing protein, partial [Pedobacter sp.]
DQKTMLDFDLAELYEVETRALKQAVKRNISRFPSDFMFQLNKEEWQELITICDKLPKNAKFSPAPPFAFTEQGVAMLSSILNSEKAIKVNIEIIRIFARIRQILMDNNKLLLDIEKIKNKLEHQDKKLTNHDKNIELVFKHLDELLAKKGTQEDRKSIGYKIGK